MNLKKLSLLLALVMIVSSLSVTAFATNETELSEVLVYSLEGDKFTPRNAVTSTHQSTAPIFSEESGEKATYHTFMSGVTSTTTSAGSEPGYTLIDNANEPLGGTDIDYTKYKNIRVQFNMYIENDTNSMYLRLSRTADGTTFPKDYEYTFSIGGERSHIPTGGNASIRYTGLETGKWHSIVMELGANAENNYIRYYVDGQSVTPRIATGAYTSFPDADVAYGFGGASTARAVLSVRNRYNEPLGVYLKDFEIYASNTEYNPANDVVPSVEVNEDAVAFMEDGKVYGIKKLAEENLTFTNADYKKIDAANNYIFTYNNTSNRVKYYDFINDGCYVRDERVSITSSKYGADAVFYNFKDKKDQVAIVVATYKLVDGVPTLVDTRITTQSAEAGTKENCTAWRTIQAGKEDFDYAKAFFWEGVSKDRIPFIEAVYKEK